MWRYGFLKYNPVEGIDLRGVFFLATMKDVAALAGVDKGTVSRVLNGDPRISAATAERVGRR